MAPKSPTIDWLAGRGWKAFPFQRDVWKAMEKRFMDMLRGVAG